MLAYRFAISSVIALVLLPTYKHHLPKDVTSWFVVIIYGFLVSTVTLGFYFIGINYSSSLVAGMSSVFQPMLAGAAGVLFLREHITRREKAGIGIALLGSLIITFEPLLKDGHLLGTLFGNLMLLGSRIADTASSIMGKLILRTKVSPIALTHVSFIVGFISILPIVWLSNENWQIFNAPAAAHLGTWFMAIVSGTLAYTWWHQAEKSIEVGEATLSYYLHPLFTAPLAFLWLHEGLTLVFVLGSAVTAVGVVLAETKPNKRAQRTLRGSAR
jgi:drug/metabolite transporter (DMT)-like permease